ncbi:MAG TPA: helix-turn-helix transcriptional regulator [Pilimelia sp.]|nr:helix-turn-helix transcriptional regulator [Pilimelia sp.]
MGTSPGVTYTDGIAEGNSRRMGGEHASIDGCPPWARRIRAERTARGWSQATATEALRAHAGVSLPGAPSLLRNWKRWEAGDAKPDDFYRPLIAKAFGTATEALFPRTTHPDADADAPTAGMDTLEIVSRMRASDLSAGTLDALTVTANRLGSDYSHVPAEGLLVDGRTWLRRLISVLGRRLTLAQHREVLALAGQVALLVGCVEYDLGRSAAAEATRRAALSLGEEAGKADVVGWAHEMACWFALTHGRYAQVIHAAAAGLTAAGTEHSVAVQLAAHQAKAWARIGDRREVEVALDRGRAILESLGRPDNPENHFVIDPPKFDFYTMDVYRHVGQDRLADAYAHEVIRASTGPDGAVRKPMRVAEAHVTLGVVAARARDVEAAVAHGRRAITGARRSLPSLLLHTEELAQVLRRSFGEAPAVAEYLDELRHLASLLR